ncbi:MAG: MutS-related protein, partial [Sarcina sp.]
YKAPFLNVVTSISPEDDINTGKSYYLAEAESMLRILNALDGKYKVFCAIDEIFRGTNPVERIAASEEILKYVQKRNSISIVATHDRELTDILVKTHNFYHFSEKVSESKGLSFDYKLKSGILTTRNAIKLLKFVGYPDEIVDGAYRSIDNNNL